MHEEEQENLKLLPSRYLSSSSLTWSFWRISHNPLRPPFLVLEPLPRLCHRDPRLIPWHLVTVSLATSIPLCSLYSRTQRLLQPEYQRWLGLSTSKFPVKLPEIIVTSYQMHSNYQSIMTTGRQKTILGMGWRQKLRDILRLYRQSFLKDSSMLPNSNSKYDEIKEAVRIGCYLYCSASAHRIGREMYDKKKIYPERHPYLVIPARLFLKRRNPFDYIFFNKRTSQNSTDPSIKTKNTFWGMTGVWRRRKVGITENVYKTRYWNERPTDDHRSTFTIILYCFSLITKAEKFLTKEIRNKVVEPTDAVFLNFTNPKLTNRKVLNFNGNSAPVAICDGYTRTVNSSVVWLL